MKFISDGFWISRLTPFLKMIVGNIYALAYWGLLITKNQPKANPLKSKLTNPCCFYFLDILSPFLDRLVELSLLYLENAADHKDVSDKAKKFQDRLHSAVFAAAIPTLIVCGEKDITAEGYPNFVTGFLDKFKLFFCPGDRLPT